MQKMSERINKDLAFHQKAWDYYPCPERILLQELPPFPTISRHKLFFLWQKVPSDFLPFPKYY